MQQICKHQHPCKNNKCEQSLEQQSFTWVKTAMSVSSAKDSIMIFNRSSLGIGLLKKAMRAINHQKENERGGKTFILAKC